jgi:hypothetical protein
MLAAEMALEQREHPGARSVPESPEPAASGGSRETHRRGALELAVAWLGLLVLGVFVFAPHIKAGGFYLDDWSNAAGTLYPPGGKSAFAYFAELTLYRPVLVLYVPLTYLVLGTHMHFQLAWSALLALAVAASLYGILRQLGVPRSHAWLVAALTIVYPWYDSTRFWETADQATLSLLFASAGLWIALVGLRRGSLRVHLVAGALFLLSILSYEVTLPLIAAFGVLYVIYGGWPAARVRWAIDIVVVIVGGLWVGLQTNHESLGVSADLTHLKEIVTSGGTLLGRSVLPLGEPATTVALVLMAVILLAGLGLWLARRTGQPRPGWGLRSWLLLSAAGLVVAILGWVMFIPANPYYTPSVYGVTNRVNALAGFGLVMAVYGTLGVLGALIAALRPSLRVLRVVPIVLGLLMGVAYTKVLERHSRIWNAAYRAEATGLSVMRAQFPRLPHGTTLFVTGYPAYQTLGVPIFSAGWDVNGMIKLQYKDGSLSAYPLLPGLAITCNPTGVTMTGPGAPATGNVHYGAARFLNAATGEHADPLSQAGCVSLVPRYPPGPLYISTAY